MNKNELTEINQEWGAADKERGAEKQIRKTWQKRSEEGSDL